MKNTQQRCPCVNTVYLLNLFLFIIFALNEIASLHPPGDSLVPIKDILVWEFRLAGITQPLRPMFPPVIYWFGCQRLQSDLHCKSSSLISSEIVFQKASLCTSCNWTLTFLYPMLIVTTCRAILYLPNYFIFSFLFLFSYSLIVKKLFLFILFIYELNKTVCLILKVWKTGHNMDIWSNYILILPWIDWGNPVFRKFWASLRSARNQWS